ncbi:MULTISPECIES: hypothetical protein [unclassified Streptomyces]|uniref:hypothetical protein n=1 Tax=unclassified Streptomyces TaxID=2593676 RepID=UPI002E16732D|nr:hypothetical protein OG452_04415 [Streptomyces sp. NBC_01197]WSS52612.1 hypothetical protein OG708_30660 [Streptomyces sp. NBC_01180]
MADTDNQDTLVTVALTGHSEEDAATVFGALRSAFPCDRAAGDAPQPEVPGRVTVWAASYEVLDADPGKLGAASLTAPVMATVQGGYHAVDLVRTALSTVFAVEEQGEALGDQEKELNLQLANR